jgi:hypothetical protein
MRETFTSGSVGRAPGNRCLYPEPDGLQRPLVPRSRFRPQVSASVSTPSEAWRFLQGVSPCGVRSNQPLLPSVASVQEVQAAQHR